ncbi:MAG: ABC transporter substrate-binding protein [Actinomycetota bacterium]|nr:ABC transporter substrate-binding protein [Actinomycetota bacterium]MDH5224066.1 ABC transporter substrate-binding protein [Actinomycetota bacterium]MDH5314304.1 ABC transporter substrate-binding protein [Actinomycetota bacterium]
MRNHRMFVLGAGLLALSLFAAACGDSGGDDTGGGASASAEPKGELVVGVSGAFAENQLVAEMYAQVLEANGYTVKRELEIADRAVGNEALTAGEIDLKPEYTGFDLPQYDESAPTNGDPAAVAAALSAAVASEGLVTYAHSPANSTNVFVVLPETAEANNLTDMSSLAAVAGGFKLGAPPDCPKSDFCIPGLKDTYGIEFADFKPLDFGGPKTVAAVDSGAVEVGELFSLDPTIVDKGYVVLTDDMNLQANGNFIPVVREEVASDELGALLDSVTTTLTDENMRDMVGQVVNDKRDVADVASEYLTGAGIL